MLILPSVPGEAAFTDVDTALMRRAMELAETAGGRAWLPWLVLVHDWGNYFRQHHPRLPDFVRIPAHQLPEARVIPGCFGYVDRRRIKHAGSHHFARRPRLLQTSPGLHSGESDRASG